MSRETKSHHVRRLCQMYAKIATATKPLSQDTDKTESMLYEPANAILNFLRLRTDQRLSVSPVRRLIREYLADVDGCRSFAIMRYVACTNISIRQTLRCWWRLEHRSRHQHGHLFTIENFVRCHREKPNSRLHSLSVAF